MTNETNLYYVIFKDESAKLCSEDEAAEIMETDENAALLMKSLLKKNCRGF